MAQATKIAAWWSEPVRAWFSEQFSSPALSNKSKARLRRLAHDDQMKSVAHKFARLQKQNRPNFDRTIIFLQRALEAPALWHERMSNPSAHTYARLNEFPLACRQMSLVLARERANVTYYLMWVDRFEHGGLGDVLNQDGELNPTLLKLARTQYEALVALVKKLGNIAENVEDSPLAPQEIALPRKVGQKAAETVFCIQTLLRLASFYFERPLLGEVATTVTVLLDLPDAVSLESVKSIRKTMKKRGDSGEAF